MQKRFLVFIAVAPFVLGAQEASLETSQSSEQEQSVPLSVVTVVSAEEQIPFDAAGNVRIVDENLRVRYGLFPDVTGFRQALLFKKGEAYELAITTEAGDRRVPITADQLAAIRDKLAPKLAKPPILVTPAPESPVPTPRAPKRPLYNERDGFVPFVAYTTLWSGLYGVALPFIFGGYDAHWALYPGIGFLAAGGAFGLSYYLGKDAGITRGMAFGAGEGAFRGAMDGMFLWWLIAGSLKQDEHEGGNDEIECDLGIGEETYGRLMVTSILLFSMAEYGLGMWYAQRTDATGGEMRLMGAGSLFGYATMLELLATILDEDIVDNTRTVRIIPAFMLAGGVGGLLLGREVSRWDRYTEGDVTLLYTGMSLGTYLPVSILITAKAKESRLYTGLMFPGTIGGAVASYFLLKGLDFSDLDAFLFNLGTLAGGLTTTGIGYLTIALAKEEDNITWLGALSSAGLMAGYGIMYAVLRDKGLRQAADEDARLGWRFNINPAGIAAAITQPRTATLRTENDLRLLRETPVHPLFSLEYRW